MRNQPPGRQVSTTYSHHSAPLPSPCGRRARAHQNEHVCEAPPPKPSRPLF
jgi:hypothetical protein